ncbi:MAG: aminotransferase class V-fold PLP-dependent enzyme [Phycisphaera sp.]|nr:aminotransferase class V-fold PLP-dependent enzyme [Phycisphaera sp.]
MGSNSTPRDSQSEIEPTTFGVEARRLWALGDDVVFLNHGSFGAVPIELLERASELRREIESNPVAGVWRRGFPDTRDAAVDVAAFIGSRPRHTAFVANATHGINAMLQSLPLQPGDEVLHVDQGYNAVWQTILLTGRRRGVVPRKVELPLPVHGPDDVLEAFEAAFTNRTRLLVLDQVTSPTALVLPIRQLIDAAAARGIETIIDGAHAPGMIDQPASAASEAAAWTGNLHKWPCALRGTAVLTVRKDRESILKPTVISHHFDESFAAEFDWQGTHDPTAWLLAPEAIRFMDRFGGWDAVRARNQGLTVGMHQMLCERFGVAPISPLDGSMLGFMATVELPAALQPEHGGPPLDSSTTVHGPDGKSIIGMDPIQRHLLEEHRIEVPILTHDGRRFVRFSVHVHNHEQEYQQLADAITRIAAD